MAAGPGRCSYAVAIGATLAWAVFCDVYYAVYGVLIVACWTAAQGIVLTAGQPRDRRLSWLIIAADALIIVVAVFVTVIAVQGGLIGPPA